MHHFTETEQYVFVFSIIGVWFIGFLWSLNKIIKALQQKIQDLNNQ